MATKRILRESAESLVALDIKERAAHTEVLQVLPQITLFARTYMDLDTVGPTKNFSGTRTGSRMSGNTVRPDIRFCAQSIEATEETLVAHEMGLKGNVDLTVSAAMAEVHPILGDRGSLQDRKPVRTPIELKTGHSQKPQSAHMAQLSLYNLLLGSRHGAVVNGAQPRDSGVCFRPATRTGVLLYLNDKAYNATQISPDMSELKSLIGQRNIVASGLVKAALPRGVEVVPNTANDSTTYGAAAGPLVDTPR